MSSEPPRVSYEPMRNLPIDPVRNPVEPIRKKADTNWCQRRIYTMDQSFPNLQTNFITRDSDILHWFQFLRLTDQEQIHIQVRKIEKFCQKYFSLPSLVFAVEDTFTKGFTVVAYSYPACELKYIDPIFMRKTRILAVMTVW